ncbi:RNA polymerase sigma factor [Sunxiuqinia rutila]|uniref:RNA polymerase sigma factor n=1 Tax=Sunxiuqinia rutila TaxID=1397841 RepID=UPI003D3657EA
MDIDSSKNWLTFLEGDRDALGRLFRLYFSDLLAYGMKFIPSDDSVKDHIQNLFVRLWEKRTQLRPVGNVKVYLLISLKHDLLQSLKAEQPKKKLEEIMDAGWFEISVEDFMVEREQEAELSQKVVSCLEQLTSRQREVIYLRFYHNFDFPNIAEIMEMNIQSVRNLLFRTLEKIRKEVGESDIHQPGNIELILLSLFGHSSCSVF